MLSSLCYGFEETWHEIWQQMINNFWTNLTNYHLLQQASFWGQTVNGTKFNTIYTTYMDGHEYIDSECDSIKIIKRNYRSISFYMSKFGIIITHIKCEITIPTSPSKFGHLHILSTQALVWRRNLSGLSFLYLPHSGSKFWMNMKLIK